MSKVYKGGCGLLDSIIELEQCRDELEAIKTDRDGRISKKADELFTTEYKNKLIKNLFDNLTI